MSGCEWTKAGQLDPRAPGPSPLWSALGSPARALQPKQCCVLSVCCLVPAFVVSMETPTHTLWARGGGVRATFGLLWESPCPARRQSPSTECWIHSKWVNEGISPREQLCLSTVSLSKQDLCLVLESHSGCWKVTRWLKASGLPWWPSG